MKALPVHQPWTRTSTHGGKENVISKIERALISAVILCALSAATAVHAAAQGEPTTLVTSQTASDSRQGPDTGESSKPSPVSTYKINYFTINRIPTNENAQVKFQFSVKYKFFNHDISIFGHPLALYLAYSQKSLWNVGQDSMPFEESNYNPETFFDYQGVLTRGSFAVRDIIVSPYEHESNGLAGPQSRGWNRLYAAVRLGYWPLEHCDDASAAKDHVELFIKVWRAYGYSDETTYLQSIGNGSSFLDYEGFGEVHVVLRDIIFEGDRGNRFEIASRVGGKENIELQYVQKIPSLNFSPYFQYWYGYDETLLRFDRFGKRAFFGVSFVY